MSGGGGIASKPVATAHGYVDGGHLRAIAEKFKHAPLNPRLLVDKVLFHKGHQWANHWAGLSRVGYYDAAEEGGANTLEPYWKAIEQLDDTELRFGWYRARARAKPHDEAGQKAVDVQLAVDLVVGAYSGTFKIAIVVSGDADFVPAIEEAKRQGVMVIVASTSDKVSDRLKASADRYFEITPNVIEDCELKFVASQENP